MLDWIIKNAFKVNYFLAVISFFILLTYIFIFTPLAFFRKTRSASAFAFYLGSFVFGINLWLGSFVITIILAGLGWLIFGLLIAGIGIIPIAFIALLLNREWVNLLEFAVLIAMTFGFRTLGLWLGYKRTNKYMTQIESYLQDKIDIL